jgi:uncharacterized protein
MGRARGSLGHFCNTAILPNREGIVQGLLSETPLGALPDWNAVMGLQFENLVLNNVHSMMPLMRLTPGDVALYGPFFQRETKRQRGCQVDLLLQTRFRTVFLCEVKFSSSSVGMEVVHQVRAKAERMSLPRGWSKRMVLIHANGVTDDVVQSGCFDHIIDFSELLNFDS